MSRAYDNEAGKFVNTTDSELRDRFAMAALTGLLAQTGSVLALKTASGGTSKTAAQYAADLSYELADAMMEARK